MRRAMSRLRFAFILLACVLCAVGIYALRTAPVFTGGYGYELYLGTSSAEILRTDSPARAKLFRFNIRGESVRYEGDCYEALRKQFRAKVRFTEETEGIVNYYLYSPKLSKGIMLDGYEINLHIAVSPSQTAAGTPIIFGGF